MTMQKIPVGTNPDGTQQYHYYNPGGHVLLTGAGTGVHTTDDGTTYDCTPDVIATESVEHAQQLAASIARQIGA